MARTWPAVLILFSLVLLEGCVLAAAGVGAAGGFAAYKAGETARKGKTPADGDASDKGKGSTDAEQHPDRPRTELGGTAQHRSPAQTSSANDRGLPLAETTQGSEGEVLTNDSIVKMVRAGIDQNVIVMKVQLSKVDFDLRTEALITLRQAGVSDRILGAMLTRIAGGTSARSQPAGPALSRSPGSVPPDASLLSPVPGQVKDLAYYIRAGEQFEIDYIQGRRTMGGFILPKMKAVFGGARARLRVTEDRPTFYLGWNPTESPLVRLDSDGSDNERKVGIGRGAFPIFVEAREGPSEDDMVAFDIEKLPSGYYRVTPKSPLEKGEYGFLRLPGGALGGQPRIYDFGRD